MRARWLGDKRGPEGDGWRELLSALAATIISVIITGCVIGLIDWAVGL